MTLFLTSFHYFGSSVFQKIKKIRKLHSTKLSSFTYTKIDRHFFRQWLQENVYLMYLNVSTYKQLYVQKGHITHEFDTHI